MRISHNLAVFPLVIFLTEITYGRDLRRDLREITDLRDSDATPGLLLSALCVQDGQLRKSCLEDISSVSIKKLLDKMVDEIRENERYGSLLRELDLSSKDEIIPSENVPEKRGRSRSRNTSGFYSNW
ncbi:uncharacterized protein LOC123542772 isoform X2 [Mercenaria mercenaria]|uniref:uncharacterized protein LOC123542772 isoform X2 n=1 Tax=Mercenaria mercenaria TaxID=6596 RepID=UPI00234F722B|nr:uncharacterized protein LOC123542772 isoform X2 [Mercenaria mercenaria]XP_045184703.2 uncharacterized protein LOC123542772 isoform X2 [Mercenaria mercenaria]XP_053387394.1 uncharacterized protein LOC123542772 isoform X2 [Mercenaria mercenaria]XP_053387395.1 uncharacterized protein LOC123542772 isoform X2 [Mercenaria mercenaria]